jgi:HEAT repeat protein
MRDAPDGKHSFQGDKHGKAGWHLPFRRSSPQGQPPGEEETNTSSLPPEHAFEESDEKQTEKISVDSVQFQRHDQDTSDGRSSSDTDLLPLLLDPDFRVRTNALNKAQDLAPQLQASIISALQRVLGDPQINVRVFALEALGSLDRSAQVEIFARTIHDPAWRVRTTAVRELGKLDKAAPKELLLEALKDSDVTVRDAALWGLYPLAVWTWEELKDRRLLDACIAALHDPSELIRAAAAEIVGDFESYIPEQELTHLLKHDSSKLVRAAAAEALGKMGARQPTSFLLLALHTDKSEIVRASAAEALGEMRAALPIGPLLHALSKDGSNLVRVAALKSLGQAGEDTPIEILKALILALNDEEEEISEQAYDSLSELYEYLYERAALPALFSWFQTGYDEVYQLAFWLLNVKKEQDVRKHLADALLSANDTTRKIAHWALEQLAKRSLEPGETELL